MRNSYIINNTQSIIKLKINNIGTREGKHKIKQESAFGISLKKSTAISASLHFIN